MKNAPAPSAITVRSRKIQRPKAKRLSMLVWFRPLTRHSRIAYSPNAEQRRPGRQPREKLAAPNSALTPRRMSAYPRALLASGRPRRCPPAAAPTPAPSGSRPSVPCRVLPGAGTRSAPRASPATSLARSSRSPNVIARVRAGLDARRHVIGGVELAPARGGGFGLRGLPPRVAEVALLDDPAHPRRHIGVQRRLHPLRPLPGPTS